MSGASRQTSKANVRATGIENRPSAGFRAESRVFPSKDGEYLIHRPAEVSSKCKFLKV
jgi:hypothetical protein